MSNPVLVCRGITKRFGAVTALKSVDFQLEHGEVRALLGKNGAGKSTLVNLISGSLTPDEGTIELNGEAVTWSGPRAAQDGGIAVVHQEFSLVPGLTVAENITLGRWPKKGVFVDAATLKSNAQKALDRLGVDIDLSLLVGQLALADQQLVEIAKALVDEPQVLILDEPTSALNANEVNKLLALVRRLATTGVSVIYVSHRMKEIPLVADTLTVLRDGLEIDTVGVKDVSSDQVAELISGESNTDVIHDKYDRTAEPVVLEVKELSVPHRLNKVSFSLHKGEVLGIAGLLGSGRTELLESIFGTRTDCEGEVIVNGVPQTGRKPKKMLDQGIGLTPEDRKGSGIAPLLGIGENLSLSARGRVLPKFWISGSGEKTIVDQVMTSMSVKASSTSQEIGTLSGGNQQKGVIGRALAAKMQVLLLDEPTRGVDLNAKAQIYGLIRDLANEGVSSIFVSSELEEIAEVCDRVLILRDGSFHEELIGSEGTAEKILALAMRQENSDD